MTDTPPEPEDAVARMLVDDDVDLTTAGSAGLVVLVIMLLAIILAPLFLGIQKVRRSLP